MIRKAKVIERNRSVAKTLKGITTYVYATYGHMTPFTANNANVNLKVNKFFFLLAMSIKNKFPIANMRRKAEITRFVKY